MLSIIALLVFLSGCATNLAPRIDQGGFLKQEDYTALQKAMSHLPVHPTGYLGDLADMPWSPTWVYYAENINLARFDLITIPDLKLQVHGDNNLAKEIPDELQEELIDKKLFHKVLREEIQANGLA